MDNVIKTFRELHKFLYNKGYSKGGYKSGGETGNGPAIKLTFDCNTNELDIYLCNSLITKLQFDLENDLIHIHSYLSDNYKCEQDPSKPVHQKRRTWVSIDTSIDFLNTPHGDRSLIPAIVSWIIPDVVANL